MILYHFCQNTHAWQYGFYGRIGRALSKWQFLGSGFSEFWEMPDPKNCHSRRDAASMEGNWPYNLLILLLHNSLLAVVLHTYIWQRPRPNGNSQYLAFLRRAAASLQGNWH